jgi:hypothetical protein
MRIQPNPEPIQRLGIVYALACDSNGNLYMAQFYGIRRISPGQYGSITTLAGGVASGYLNGMGSNALFRSISDICVVGNEDIYVVDESDHRIRRITVPRAESISLADLQLDFYPGLKINGVPGRTYQIERADSLSNWSTAAILSLPTTPYLWLDVNSTNRTRQFYRAILLP